MACSDVKLQDLLIAGVHFGHLTRRWNPKMKKYIFMERNGIYIIDLKKTLTLLNKACEAMTQIVRSGESVLFVGTKKQAKDIVRAEAERCNQFYVVERWLGGTLTNFVTIRKSIKRLKNLEKMATDGTYEKLTKKEILRLEREKAKLEKVLGGIRDMNRLPGAVYIVDVKKELIAVNEARRLNIPVFAILDTNADPDLVDYPIPGNDDAFKSINVITHAIADAVLEGLEGRSEASLQTPTEEELKYAEAEAQAQAPAQGA
ncbi:MAG: 30S ribosomal protein S2 [Calditrichaeota bacterium]|nr:30S ribosomal protein S2 [Calditrichota bacterium]